MERNEIFQKRIEELAETVDPYVFQLAVLEYFKRKVARTQKCLITNTSLPFDDYCLYCRRDCIWKSISATKSKRRGRDSE